MRRVLQWLRPTILRIYAHYRIPLAEHDLLRVQLADEIVTRMRGNQPIPAKVIPVFSAYLQLGPLGAHASFRGRAVLGGY